MVEIAIVEAAIVVIVLWLGLIADGLRTNLENAKNMLLRLSGRLAQAETEIARLEDQANTDRRAWDAIPARVETLEELAKAEDEIRAAAATTIRRFLEEPKLKRKAKKA